MTIELAFIADGDFLRHTAVALHSALSHARDPVAVTILHCTPVGADDRERMRQVAAPFGAQLRFVAIAADAVADFPDGYFPRSVFFRVLLPELLPRASRVLYLDSDIVVTDDLGPLWRTDVSGHLLGAVVNPLYRFLADYPRKLGIERPQDYFNSGVLLMNLERMRAEGISRQLREYAQAHSRNWFPDQDALNVVCRGRWLRLHPRWNLQSPYEELAPDELAVDPAQLHEARQRPALIHYIGPFKPWQYLCRHARRELYFQHARATPWGAPPIEGRSLRNALLRPLPLAWIDRWFRLERILRRLWRRTAVRLAVRTERA